jgi:hypothetical protein
MAELIDFLLFAIFFIYVVPALARLILPMLFQGAVNRAQQQQRNPGNQQRNYSQNPNPGKVKVDHVPNQKKRGTIPDSEGEFIDYEEIK